MKKELTLVLALCTMLSVVLTGCGSSKNNNESSAANSNSSTAKTSSSSVDTSNFVDITVEGIDHKVTYMYDKDAYELEISTLITNDTVSKCYVADSLGSVTTTLTTYNGQELTAEEAEKTMTSNEDMMNTIYDYTCEAYSNSGLEGYVETYYYNATNTANRTYVLSDGDFYMYIMVSYQFSDPFDLEFSVETM